MKHLFRQAGSLFLDSEPAESVVGSGTNLAAVLGASQAALPLAAVVEAQLRAECSVPTVLICVWSDDEIEIPAGGFAIPGARRLAARLSRRNLAAVARGRLVWHRLSQDSGRVFSEVQRISAAVDVPVIVVIAGARDQGIEGLIEECDTAFISLPDWADRSLVQVALLTVAEQNSSPVICRSLPRAFRRVALSGMRWFGATGCALNMAVVSNCEGDLER